MNAVTNERNKKQVYLTAPDTVWTFTFVSSEEDSSTKAEIVLPLLFSDSLGDVILCVTKKLKETLDLDVHANTFSDIKHLSVENCLAILKQRPDVELAFHLHQEPNQSVRLSCPKLDNPEETNDPAHDLVFLGNLEDVPSHMRDLDLLKLAEQAEEKFKPVMDYFTTLSTGLTSAQEMSSKFNFAALSNGLEFVANVGGILPFVSSACQVFSAFADFIESLEENEKNVAQLQKHTRLLRDTINLRIRIYFDKNSRWVVDDETCLAVYRDHLQTAIEVMIDAIRIISDNSKDGYYSKMSGRHRLDLQMQEKKLDFVLRALLMLEPFHLAFDFSLVEDKFHHPDSLAFWKTSRFRTSVPTPVFLHHLCRYTKTEWTTDQQSQIIQSIDKNMDGFIQADEFADSFKDGFGEDAIQEFLVSTRPVSSNLRMREHLNPTDCASDSYLLLSDYIVGTREDTVDSVANIIDKATESCVLALVASPGFGKSVIVARLVEKLLAAKKGVLFYYFRADDAETRTIDKFLQTIMFQLCCIKENCDDPLPLQITETITDRKSMMKLVTDVMKNCPCTLVVDACDECPEFAALVDVLVHFASELEVYNRVVLTIRNDTLSSKNPKMREMIQQLESRSQQREFNNIRTLYSITKTDLEDATNEAGNNKAVQIFFESSLPYLSVRGCELLVEKAKGNLLWAKLALSVIRDSHTNADITFIAHTVLKEDLGCLYEQSFRSSLRISYTYQNDLKCLLSVVFCATQPLLLSDLKQLWAINNPGWTYDKSAQHFSQVFVYPLCRLMLRTNSNGRVLLGHKSLRDLIDIAKYNRFIDKKLGHEILAKCCLDAISHSRGSNGLLEYASLNWYHHCIESGVDPASKPLIKKVEAAAKGYLSSSTGFSEGRCFILAREWANNDVSGIQFGAGLSMLLCMQKPIPFSVISEYFGGSNLTSILLQVCHESKYPSGQIRAFFTNSKRHIDPKFLVNQSFAEQEVARHCFLILETLHENMTSIESPYIEFKAMRKNSLGEHVQYAVRYWVHHFACVEDTSELLGFLERFCAKSLLCWIEVILTILHNDADKFNIILECLDTVQRKIAGLKTMAKSLLFDAFKLVFEFQAPLNFNPLQVYHSALVWCPQGTELYKRYSAMGINIPKVLFDPWIQWKAYHDLGGHLRTSLETEESFFRLKCVASTNKYIVAGYHHNKTNSRSHVRIWQVGTENLIVGSNHADCDRWGFSNSVTAVTISPDNTWAAAGSTDGFLSVRFFDDGKIWKFHKLDGEIKALAVSADGRLLASASSNQKIQLWDHLFVKPIRDLNGHTGAVNSIAISHDMRYLVSGSDDKTVRLWTLATSQHKTYTFPQEIGAIAIAGDGKTIVAGGSNGDLWSWNPKDSWKNCDEIRPWKNGHFRRVTSVQFSSNGSQLVSSSEDHAIYLWNVNEQSRINNMSLNGPVIGISLAPDDSCISAATVEKIVIYDNLGFQSLPSGKNEQKGLITARIDSATDVTSNNQDGKVGFDGDCIKVSADESMIVILTEKYLKIWSSVTNTYRLFEVDFDDVEGLVAISRNNEFIVFGSEKSLQIFSLKGETFTTCDMMPNKLQALAISDNGCTVAFYSAPEDCKVWFTEDNRLVSINLGVDSFRTLSLTNHLLAFVSKTGVHIWSLETLCLVQEIIAELENVELLTILEDESGVSYQDAVGKVELLYFDGLKSEYANSFVFANSKENQLWIQRNGQYICWVPPDSFSNSVIVGNTVMLHPSNRLLKVSFGG
ncbi:UNVERIFIED_CONTAM: hypothetical protein HDU68_008615 [Siphonaria sp. JEL0065]|nr:hypothetical protein HDU68_008615 [Siphonaria sp. JEL0065]